MVLLQYCIQSLSLHMLCAGYPVRLAPAPVLSQLFPSSGGGDSLVGGLSATIAGLGLGGPSASTAGGSAPGAALGLSSQFSLPGRLRLAAKWERSSCHLSSQFLLSR